MVMATKTDRISVALAVYNEEKNLEACLSSVRDWADEIVVVDGGSDDRTVDIARSSGARIIETDNPPIFHINKEIALKACRNPWILQLDADEVVPEALREEIEKTIPGTKHAGFYMPRKNYFINGWLTKGGQYPDYVIRLVRKGRAHFPAKSVHEQIAVEGTVGYLTEPLLHYTNRTFDDYWRKAAAYTALTARDMKKRNLGKDPVRFIYYMSIKPLWTFGLIYFRHKGFVDGSRGFLFALFSGLHHPIAYWKYLSGKKP